MDEIVAHVKRESEFSTYSFQIEMHVPLENYSVDWWLRFIWLDALTKIACIL